MTEYIGYLDEDHAPVVDMAQEIVRCRDCKHYDPNDEPSEVYPNSYWCDKLTVYMPPNGFCPWGKRREVE